MLFAYILRFVSIYGSRFVYTFKGVDWKGITFQTLRRSHDLYGFSAARVGS